LRATPDPVRARRRIGSAAAAVAVAAIAGVALADGVRGGPEPVAKPAEQPAAAEPASATLSGADLPPRGALAGRLLYTEGEGCRLRALELRDLTLTEPGLATGCRFWASPRGDLAAASTPDGGGLAFVRVEGRPELVRPLGAAESPPSWSLDGARLAWCSGGSTVVLEVATGERAPRPGCYPVFEPTGELVTRRVVETGLEVLRDGKVVVRPAPGTARRVVGHAVLGDGRLVLAIHGGPNDAVLELWRGETLQRTVPVRTYGMIAEAFGVRLDVAAVGEAAVTAPSNLGATTPDDLVSLVDLRAGRPVDGIAERPQGGVAWAPDGAWVAFSTGKQILVFARGASEPTYILPVAATALAWR
jgi:hypothetical protein